MMTVKDIYNTVDELYPFSLACDFDNCGLLIGNSSSRVTKACVMLDCTADGIEKAAQMGAEVIVCHHPVIFDPLKNIGADSIAYKAIKKDIAVISAHTNFDCAKGGVNDCLCNVLGFNEFETFYTADGWQGRLCRFSKPKTPTQVAHLANKKLSTKTKYTAGKDIKVLAVFSGSAGGYLEDALCAGADALLCGDIKHNVFVEAKNKGVSVFDAGHYHTEIVAVEPMCRALSKKLPNIEFVPVIDDYILS